MADERLSEYIPVRITPQVKQLLVERARQEGCDIADVVRRAIRRELDLFVPGVPGSGNAPHEGETAARAAA